MDHLSICVFVLVDTPDPYVKLFIPTAPNGRKKTQTISNSKNPVWNKEFKFLIDKELENVLREYNFLQMELILNFKNGRFLFSFTVFLIINLALVFSSSDITLMEDDTFSDDLVGETETFPLSGLEIDRILRKTFVFRQVLILCTV